MITTCSPCPWLSQVPCPEVLLLREHVLLMKFIGYDGFAAPRLKDAKLTLPQQCRLVHGDFSEYNLLWYDDVVYVIDVRADCWLLRDC